MSGLLSWSKYHDGGWYLYMVDHMVLKESAQAQDPGPIWERQEPNSC